MKVPPRDVKKALDLLAAEPMRAWTLGDLAAACCVSRRTLLRNFRRFADKSPMATLRAIRLDRARQMLLAGPPGASVTSIAMQCGFHHLGRFAALYRARHDESPVTTLTRNRTGAASLAPRRAEQPTIAVMPFTTRGPGSECARDLHDQITATLRRLPWAKVVPPTGARYRLHGEVWADGVRQRVGLTLIDARTGRCLWADRLEGAVDELLRLEDRISLRLAGVLGSMTHKLQIDPHWREEPSRLDAWLALRALPPSLAIEPAEQTLELLERAMEVAPQDPLPLALASYWHGVRGGQHFAPHADRERRIASAFAARASAIETADPLAATALAAAYTLAHDLDNARIHAGRALSLDGGSAWAWGRSGWIHLYQSEPTEAIDRFQIARILAPADPLSWLLLTGIGIAHFQLGQLDEAARWCRRGLALQPRAVWINRYLAPIQELAGQRDAARAAFKQHRRSFPDLTIEQVKVAIPPKARLFEPLAEGLTRLGVPLS
jgi:AraC-like DNA-binding protein/Flp pilus assembly protein TadD